MKLVLRAGQAFCCVADTAAAYLNRLPWFKYLVQVRAQIKRY